jgi:hypothetical protein
MGNKQSSSTDINQTITSITQNLSNIMLSIKQTTSCQQNLNQQINVRIQQILNCDSAFTNTGTVNCKLSSMFNTNVDTNLITMLKQAIDQSATSGTKLVQDTLSLPLNNQQSDTNINMSTYIKNLVETNFSTDFMNTCISNSSAVQGQTLDIGIVDCTKKGSLTVSNDAELIALVNCISDNLTKLVNNDTVINEATNSATSSTDSSQEGLGSLMKYGILAFVIFGIVVVVGGLFFLSSDKGSQLAGKAIDKF